MARLSAHGSIVGEILYISRAKRYMSDGKILMNYGHGWKLHGKLKPGWTPESAAARSAENLRAHIAAHPAYAAYRQAIHDACGLAKRCRLHLAITMMPEDPDGVWSDACDSGYDSVHLDLDEIVHLCMLYRNVLKESKEIPA